MKSLESLPLKAVWLSPDHGAQSGRILMAGHKVRVAGVVQDRRLVGMLSLDNLVGVEDSAPISEFMEPATTILSGDQSVREAAKLFAAEGLEFAPVTKDGKYIGAVTSSMLLKEMNRSWDPRTNLSWPDYLREWSEEKLARGIEVCMIFIDLDDFGRFNKDYDHLVGDKVIEEVARTLDQFIDERYDVLVRFGGDEFMIATIRTREEAEEMLDQISALSGKIQVAPDVRPVTFTVGIYGGRRVKVRPEDHIAATIDNLIQQASIDALEQKKRKKSAEEVHDSVPEATAEREVLMEGQSEAPEMSMPALSVSLVEVLPADLTPGGMSRVMITVDGTVSSGVSSKGSGTVMESVANATAKALENGFPGHKVHIRDIALSEEEGLGRMVKVSGDWQTSKGARTLHASRAVNGDMYASAAEATLLAFVNAQK